MDYGNCNRCNVTLIVKRQKSKDKKMTFQKHALIVCNGKLHISVIKKLINKPQKQLEIIAADGASDYLYRYKIIPDIIIGDLDSISPAAKKHFTSKKVKIKRIADQNSNDLEKCIGYAISKGIKYILIAGFSGLRLDHTINNLSILKKFHRKVKITIYDNEFEYFFVNKKIEFAAEPGEIISIIALPKATGITTKGLKYPLNNETLDFGGRQGTLNSASQRTVKIVFRSGDLLLYKKHSFR
jgi:thiamine pyrophosphokinase